MIRFRTLCLSFVFCLSVELLGPPRIHAQESDASRVSRPAVEFIQDGDTIVFFGDSITQGGNYIDHIESWLLCRYPDRNFRVLNRGISSETISGSSESDHDPRRPWAHERFTRDITPLKPDVLVACFGMNDGNYHPFDWGRFEKYQQGIRRLIQRAKEEAQVRTIILMTPPPFDPYQRKSGDPMAKEYGYKYPAIDYDQTLGRYSDWLLSLRDEGIPVVDLHGSLNQHLRQRRQQQVSFFLAGDAVHPSMTGHWLMALQFIRQLRLSPAPMQTLLSNKVPESGWEGEVKLQGLAPIDAEVDETSAEWELSRQNEFAWQTLHWLPEKPSLTFDIQLDGQPLKPLLFATEGERGNAAVQGAKTLVSQRVELLKKVRERRNLEYWKFRSGTDKPLGNKPPVEDVETRLAELTQDIQQLRHPVSVQVMLVPRQVASNPVP